MSTSSTYDAVMTNYSYTAVKNLSKPDGYFSHQVNDRKLLTVLKNIAFKTSMLGLVCLGSIEWVAKSALSLIAYTFSLIATPIEWAVKTPYSLYNNQEFPALTTSDKIFEFGRDLLKPENPNGVSVSLYSFLFIRNRLTQGLEG